MPCLQVGKKKMDPMLAYLIEKEKRDEKREDKRAKKEMKMFKQIILGLGK